MANVLQNPDFTMLFGGQPMWWVTEATWEPVFCVGGRYGVSVVAPGQLRIDLGEATQVDPLISYPGLLYSGSGFNAGPGDVWEISFGFSRHGPGTPGGGLAATPNHVLFVRICGVFLDVPADAYKVFFLNLPYADMGSDDVVRPYDEVFQIPADWPVGQYQFAICNPGHRSDLDGQYGIAIDIFNPSLDLISGSQPPGTAGPITDTWAWVRNGTSFPGNHPNYANLIAEGFTGVLWEDIDATTAAGIGTTHVAGLSAGVWTNASGGQTAASFATQASAAVTTFAPDLLVLDVEVYYGTNPSAAWTWHNDFVTAYRALQPTQRTAVSIGPLHDDFNYAAYTAAGIEIWPQSYGATIGPDDMNPIVIIDRVVANGVPAVSIKAVLPYDVWGVDVTELRQHGIYSYSVWTADDIQGAPAPPTPPAGSPPLPGINGLAGVPSGYAFFPRPRLVPGYPIDQNVNVEWDMWQFTPPFPNGFITIGPLPHTGVMGALTPGVGFQGYWYGDCQFTGLGSPVAVGGGDLTLLFFEGALGHFLRYFYNDTEFLSNTCGWHYFALMCTEFWLVPNREYYSGGTWHYVPGFPTKLAHSSSVSRFLSDAVAPPPPDDEVRGGVVRYDVQPHSPQFVVDGISPYIMDPVCGAAFTTKIVGGPHDGEYQWHVSMFIDGASPHGCKHIQMRILSPVGDIQGEFFDWPDNSWRTLPDGENADGFSGENFFIPALPPHCFTVQARGLCAGVVGPATSCTVCIPGSPGQVKFDVHFRSHPSTNPSADVNDASAAVHLSRTTFRAGN